MLQRDEQGASSDGFIDTYQRATRQFDGQHQDYHITRKQCTYKPLSGSVYPTDLYPCQKERVREK